MVLRDAIALVREHSKVLCSERTVFTVFSLGDCLPVLSGLVKRNPVPSCRREKQEEEQEGGGARCSCSNQNVSPSSQSGKGFIVSFTDLV